MTLKPDYLRRLDDLARKAVHDPSLDYVALDIINDRRVFEDNPYLKGAYFRFYYEAKRHYRDIEGDYHG